jgi:hypothetical protein
LHTDLVLRCFDNPELLSCGDVLVGIVLELANGVRLDTVVLSRDLSGAWVTVRR